MSVLKDSSSNETRISSASSKLTPCWKTTNNHWYQAPRTIFLKVSYLKVILICIFVYLRHLLYLPTITCPFCDGEVTLVRWKSLLLPWYDTLENSYSLYLHLNKNPTDPSREICSPLSNLVRSRSITFRMLEMFLFFLYSF